MSRSERRLGWSHASDRAWRRHESSERKPGRGMRYHISPPSRAQFSTDRRFFAQPMAGIEALVSAQIIRSGSAAGDWSGSWRFLDLVLQSAHGLVLHLARRQLHLDRAPVVGRAAWPGDSSTTWSVRTKPGIRVVGTDRVWPSRQPDHGN